MILLGLPLTDGQVVACVVVADRFGVEPWEIAVHALAFRQEMEIVRRSTA